MSDQTDSPNVRSIASNSLFAVDRLHTRLDQAKSIAAAMGVHYSDVTDEGAGRIAPGIELGVWDAVADLLRDAQGALEESEGQGNASGSPAKAAGGQSHG